MAKVRKSKDFNFCYYLGPSLWLPILLIFVGFYYLGKHLGWFSETLPLWPIILIAVGLAMLVNRLRRQYLF